MQTQDVQVWYETGGTPNIVAQDEYSDVTDVEAGEGVLCIRNDDWSVVYPLSRVIRCSSKLVTE